ncbi:ABC transporter ATP-binding protein [Fundicoccus culcitae]|uniref:ATP-binding cassette domain-containing protein n=1 Tax=Fundicoccus culcitae TaxID=2969821 RepID=A0ABY5P6K7_9LACT|nr:ATP-binding cassette domain-containing protein [Fundicoccus culcitae]UUX34371.1 ATP-binding cassette domain-containing protein [Fundicoccus culcitae]
MSIINIENIQKSFGQHQVLKDVTFAITQPGIYALVGPNGSGKSTLMNIMMNLIKSDSGKVELLGESNKNVQIFNRVSFLKDNTVLYPYLTGFDHLNYAAKAYGVNAAQVNQIVDKMGIQSYVHKRTGKYSLGMKQHLLIALCILNNPDVLIMDEPLNGLDPTSILSVRDLIKALGNDGKTILISSHILSEIDAVTRDVLFLKDGEVYVEKLSDSHAEDRYSEIYRDSLILNSGGE